MKPSPVVIDCPLCAEKITITYTLETSAEQVPGSLTFDVIVDPFCVERLERHVGLHRGPRRRRRLAASRLIRPTSF